MDQYFQVLRKIQKKERNNGTLARVDETFYSDMHEYIDALKQQAMSDPFSKALSLLKQSQIIANEICGRREKKISEAAVVNIQRSYHLFTDEQKFDLVDTTPLNLTPEEEKFYYSLIDVLKNHRNNISIAEYSDDKEFSKKHIIKPKEPQKNTLTSGFGKTIKKSNSEPVSEVIEPKVSEVSPKPVSEVIEPKVSEVNPKPIKKVQSKSAGNIEDNPNAFDSQNEVYDFESQSVARETELVTMLVFDEIGAIVCVDEKVYGPFRSQDIVTLPLINAKIFFKNRKGRKVKI